MAKPDTGIRPETGPTGDSKPQPKVGDGQGSTVGVHTEKERAGKAGACLASARVCDWSGVGTAET